MAAHFQQDQSEQDAYTSLEITNTKGNGRNYLISQAGRCEKFKYAILLALACLSVALFIITLAIQLTDRIDSEPASNLQPPTSSLQPPGDVYCGGEDDFTCLENTYTTEGIVGTPNSQQLTGISGYRECYDRCRHVYGYSCNFFSFHDGTGICSISSADFYSTWTLTEQMDGAFSCYRYKYTSDQWKMMYRRPKLTKSGYTNEVTGPWFDNSYYTNESLTSAAAARPEGVSWSILKNPLVRYWESLNIDKVKVSLYKDGKEVHHLIFNGRGSNTESWFNDTFLLETTWNDLGPGNPPPQYLVWQWPNPANEHNRRAMYVLYSHGGCPNDHIWMVFIQNQVVADCDWELIGNENVPRLLYAPGDTEAHTSNATEADYMVISVKFPLSLSQEIP